VRGAGYWKRYKIQSTRCKIQYKVLVHYASYDSMYNAGSTSPYCKLVSLAARARPYAARTVLGDWTMMIFWLSGFSLAQVSKKGNSTSHLHCTENRIYAFPEKELRGLSPNSYIHVSVSDLYIPRIGPHIWLQQNRQTDPGNI
jgi:hypothetical protein